MTTLIRDLIDIPKRVHKGDFVLKLTEGVTDPEKTVKQYVVTPQLQEAFDRALGLIGSALEARTSKATYLHGSFGSGKSHFMAVLHLLLEAHPVARGVDELHGVLANHDAWLEKKKFLLVPYHMIGANSMESAILGGYVEHMQRIHPQAPAPGVYLSDPVFANARSTRASMGDETFFSTLNSTRSGDPNDGWGDLDADWDSESFEAAIAAPPGSELKSRLVGDLVDTHFPAYKKIAASSAEAFVGLDEGLAVMSQHARSLGYDAVVLFLDELILWLASRIQDRSFVTSEGQKISKLVESSRADRHIPLISFVARQRDLKDFIGDHISGAEKQSFTDVLRWWEGRFDKITLEDRNLPVIAKKRLLAPVSPEAKAQIDQAFEETTRRDDVLKVLVTATADREMFRDVYPFTPAFVDALVAVSSALQRERTALKVMLHLLVNQRDHLRLGDIVPVGDLYDEVSKDVEPFSEDILRHFTNAEKLYTQKLLPNLEAIHGIRAEEVEKAARDDPKARAWRADDRLLKTLLISALVPEVDSLKALTPNRLAALNHGSIKSPIPGREGSTVLAKLRKIAGQVGEIKISDDATNPTISLQLTGVDTESILEKERTVDTPAARRSLIKEILFKQLDLEDPHALHHKHIHTWRGTPREVEIIFGNIRDPNLPEESFKAQGTQWKVVIDFPFDEEGFSPLNDLERIQEFKSRNEDTRTLLMVPFFFSREIQRDLGTLAILRHVLRGENFDRAASHLTAVDRPQARNLLANQESQLSERIKEALAGAYDTRDPSPGTVDTSVGEFDHFQSLDTSFRPRRPVGATMREAFDNLLDQCLAHQYPAHPKFPGPAHRTRDLTRVLDETRRAARAEGRIEVDSKDLRPLLRNIAQPLKLGEMHEVAFLPGQYWRDHFDRRIAAAGQTVTVRMLRELMDQPDPMGLPREVQDLVILTYAEQTGRTFLLNAGPYSGERIGNLPDELVLKEQTLPSEEPWARAVERAGALFGLAIAHLRNAHNVADLTGRVPQKAAELKEAATQLHHRLKEAAGKLGIDPTGSPRIQTASQTRVLVDTLTRCPTDDVVGVLAAARLPGSLEAAGRSLNKAQALVRALERLDWEMLESAFGLGGGWAAEGQELRQRLVDVMQQDEFSQALESHLEDVRAQANLLLRQAAKAASTSSFAPAPAPAAAPAPAPAATATATSTALHAPGTIRPAPAPEIPVADRGGRTVVDEGQVDVAGADAARTELERILRILEGESGTRLVLAYRIERENR